MDIVGGFDIHRKQITFDYMEMDTGEVHRGKIRPANRESLRSWLEGFTEQFPGHDAAIAVEAATGWRYIVEELQRSGIESHLAEPAETKSKQGPKKRAKTDLLDAAHLRDLLVMDRLPESWIPPDHIQEIRTLVRMRHSMIEERTAYQQRIHAQLFHNGCPQERNLLAADRRERLEKLELPEAVRKVVDLSLKDLRKEGRAEKPAWVKVMAARQRKTLVVCHQCHTDIHAGRPLSNKPVRGDGTGERCARKAGTHRSGEGWTEKCR